MLIATRKSRLALWQAEHVRGLLQSRFNWKVGLLGMTTEGDEVLDLTLAKVGGKGLFVKELEAAMQDGRARLAVHSLKDVPMDLPEGFEIAAVIEREDPRDAFVSRRFPSIDKLPKGATVGTSSLRRVVQLLALRPDLRVIALRGNLDTRLRKLDEGELDAILLAAAGLKRLGLHDRITALLDPLQMLPCAGQGALGIEVRGDDSELRTKLADVSHRPTWLAVQAERAVSRTLGGSCSMPLGAYACWYGDSLEVQVVFGNALHPAAPLLRATRFARVRSESEARELGENAARLLLGANGKSYLEAATTMAAR